jgi:hypothetical protein
MSYIIQRYIAVAIGDVFANIRYLLQAMLQLNLRITCIKIYELHYTVFCSIPISDPSDVFDCNYVYQPHF